MTYLGGFLKLTVKTLLAILLFMTVAFLWNAWLASFRGADAAKPCLDQGRLIIREVCPKNRISYFDRNDGQFHCELVEELDE